MGLLGDVGVCNKYIQLPLNDQRKSATLQFTEVTGECESGL
jgi:hypothetical protein